MHAVGEDELPGPLVAGFTTSGARRFAVAAVTSPSGTVTRQYRTASAASSSPSSVQAAPGRTGA